MSELTGTILKQIREARHIPLEQVASATRIRLELLRDLEDEEFDSIASTAQKIGFLRLYTKFINPTAEEIEHYSNLHELSQNQISRTTTPSEIQQNLDSNPAQNQQATRTRKVNRLNLPKKT